MSRTRLTAALFFVTLMTIASCKKDELVPHNPPKVNAGTSKTINLPDSGVLKGSAQADSGSHVVAYLWSQVSGPASSTILDPGSDSTLVKLNVVGTYLFQLEATDEKGATGVDTVSIVVNPPVIKTLTLQPTNNPNEYGLIIYNGTDESGVAGDELPVIAWTIGGLPVTERYLEEFDLSAIPPTATIVSANLYLSTKPAPLNNGNFQDANYGSNNAMYVQQVTSNWAPNTATTNWSNQPTTTTSNQVMVPTTAQSQLDLNLDVTAMVNSMVSNSANYGFMLKLENETYYNSRIFVSSHNTNYTSKHPKLVVIYR
jgi:hypothetical protein